MKICIDTVVLIDVLKDEFPDSQGKFYAAIEAGDDLTTTVITAAELMPQFGGKKKDVQLFLRDHGIKVNDVDLPSTLLASERWMRYLKKRKARRCPFCKAVIPGRDAILTDFLIGGYALTHCDRILTRDRGVFRIYFRDLPMV